MSTPTAKRKRTRKACIPCHQRKRKCDAKLPCSMCSTYAYECRYSDNRAARVGEETRQLSGQINHLSIDRENGQGVSQSNVPLQSSDDHLRETPATHEATPSAKSPARVAHATVGMHGTGFNQHRLIGSAAATTFPHVLGIAFGNDKLPNLPSLAYNFGTRPEEAGKAHSSLAELIQEDDLDFYSGVYFSTLASIGDLIDPTIYLRRCRDYYQDFKSTEVAFGAIAAGIAALGSFLSASRHPRESDLVQYAKAILDDPASMRVLQIDHIIAWGMRIFYLRATSRPNSAWIASCTTMHLCEAVGLHEEDNIKQMESATGAADLGHDGDRLRRIFWITWAGHSILSYECDRSSVQFRSVTTRTVLPMSGSVAAQFIQIAQIIPSQNSPFRPDPQSQTLSEDVIERLRALEKLELRDPFLVVTKADIAFCFYRRLYQLRMGISDEVVQFVINAGNAALESAKMLASRGRLFWNVIGSVFQFTCILLAIDTPEASALVPTAFAGLENLVKTADTGLTREALSMAHHLLNLNMARKQKQLAQLELVQNSSTSAQMTLDVDANVMSESELVIDWDQFLFEPYLSVFSRDV